MLMRLTDNDFKEEYEVTVGVEFGSFLVKIDDKIIKLQIWDTAGQESFKSLNKIFYRGSNCVFLVYDITREETFANVEDWLREVNMNTNNDCMAYLVGNQLDNEMQRDVTVEKAEAYARENLMAYNGETSAKTGQNIEEIFVRAAKMLYLKHKDELSEINKPKGDQISRGGARSGGSHGRPGARAGASRSSERNEEGGCKC